MTPRGGAASITPFTSPATVGRYTSARLGAVWHHPFRSSEVGSTPEVVSASPTVDRDSEHDHPGQDHPLEHAVAHDDVLGRASPAVLHHQRVPEHREHERND